MKRIKYIVLMAITLLSIIIPVNSVFAEDKKSLVFEDQAYSSYMTEYNTGKVLYAKNENSKHQIASMVKIMTLSIVFDKIEAGEITEDQCTTISHNAASMTGSELFIDEGKEYRIGDLIKGAVVVSANDACVALAEEIANSEDSFVVMMNDKAKELGMNDTMFVNCTGLPQEGQYSTAKDVNIMTRYLLNHSKYYDYSGIWYEEYKHPSGRITELANTNKLIRYYEGCDGGKTGYTDKALFCLSASAKRNNMRLVATVIGASSSKARFRQVSEMFNYGFRNYAYRVIKSKNELIENNITVRHGKQDSIKLVLEEDLIELSDKKNKVSYNIEYKLPATINAPVKKGDIIGECVVKSDGEVVKNIKIVAAESIERSTFWDEIRNIVK